MIQDSLVDYIASQVKLGVSRDSIKTALVGVGWAAQDVEDTFKKVEGGASASPAAATPMAVSASPVTSAVAAMGASPMQKPAASSPATSSPSMSSMAAAKSPVSPASQTIRVSDLVSASLTPTSMSPAGVKVSPTSMVQNKVGGGAGAIGASAASVGMGDVSKKRMGKSAYIMIGLILILAGVSAFLYFQNSSLSSQLQTAGGVAGGAAGTAAAQVSDLTGQVQQLTASSTALTAQIANLTAQVAELQADLSFFMVPTGQMAGVPVAVSVIGTLSGTKQAYVVTTAEGVKVAIKNSTNADVQAALQPLVAAMGATSTVQIAGTHLPGVANVTVTAVNGQPVVKPMMPTSTPAAAATSTTSTMMMASTTAASSTP